MSIRVYWARPLRLKSQTGPSFGNNFNNRYRRGNRECYGYLGRYREGRFGTNMFRPWLGYLFLVEDCLRSSTPVGVKEPHFQIDQVFRDASYKKRYEIFCQRLVLERVYDSSCFLTAQFSDNGVAAVTEPNPNLSVSNFLASLKGHMQILKNQAVDVK